MITNHTECISRDQFSKKSVHYSLHVLGWNTNCKLGTGQTRCRSSGESHSPQQTQPAENKVLSCTVRRQSQRNEKWHLEPRERRHHKLLSKLSFQTLVHQAKFLGNYYVKFEHHFQQKWRQLELIILRRFKTPLDPSMLKMNCWKKSISKFKQCQIIKAH